MATPPPNLPTTPFDSPSAFAKPGADRQGSKAPGGGLDAPDPFGGSSAIPPVRPPLAAPPPRYPAAGTVPAAKLPSDSEPAPLAPPAFRQPRPAPRGRRTFMLIISGVIVLVLLGVVGVVAARLLFSGPGDTGGESPTPSPEATSSPLGSLPTALPSPVGGGDATNQVADDDGDGLTNAEEAYYRTDPAKADTDEDGFTDSQEVRAGYDPLGPGKLDSDNDGFPDPDEREFGSDPFNPDTDGDGFSDGKEIENGYNPLIPSPGDKL